MARRHVARKLRTALSLPGRVVEVEDAGRALEARVAERLHEVRFELAEIRRILEQMSEAGTESLELTGRLLLAAEARLDALEEHAGGGSLPLPALGEVASS